MNKQIFTSLTIKETFNQTWTKKVIPGPNTIYHYLSTYNKNNVFERFQKNIGFKQERVEILSLLSKLTKVWGVAPRSRTVLASDVGVSSAPQPGCPWTLCSKSAVTAATWNHNFQLTASQLTRMPVTFLVDVPCIWEDVSPRATERREAWD